jgi:radical SAM superfamily enzyme YgiQ (UPF0313 family)
MVATASPGTLLAHSGVDAAVIDEGELTFRELVSVYRRGGDLGAVKGICFKQGGQIRENQPRERISDLDALPYPAWDIFDMEAYLRSGADSLVSYGLRALNISSVRGCPYECTFCSHPFGRQVYARSARSIAGEMAELAKRYGVGFIKFTDDLFLVNENRVMELCDRILLGKIKIKWSAAARVNLVNRRLLKAMRRAGCAELGYGFESGSQRILDGMKKRVTVAQAQEAIRLTREAGIRVSGSFIIGMPEETERTIDETVEFAKRTGLPIHRFFYATPYPRTQLYDTAKAMGRIPDDEDRYLESLGEMRLCPPVNLTDFSDAELVRLKTAAEARAKKNLPVREKWNDCREDWLRRLGCARMSISNGGVFNFAGSVSRRAWHKLAGRRAN